MMVCDSLTIFCWAFVIGFLVKLHFGSWLEDESRAGFWNAALH